MHRKPGPADVALLVKVAESGQIAVDDVLPLAHAIAEQRSR